jgi:ketosteroid isomerase-like protein
MKKNIFLKLAGMLAVVLVLGLVFVSCGGGNTPSATVTKFYASLEKWDVKGLEATATPEVVQMLTVLGGEEKIKAAVQEQGKITVVSETIDGDAATVTISYDGGDEEEIDLVKVDGKWKVTINK